MNHVPVHKDDHKNQIDDSWHDRDSLVHKEDASPQQSLRKMIGANCQFAGL